MNRRISLALATAGAVILAGISPVQADTPDSPPAPEQEQNQSTDNSGSSGSSNDEDTTGFPHSSQDPEKTSSENLSSTLVSWNELSPKAEEVFEWLGLIVGILTAVTQAALIIVSIIQAFS